MPGPIARPRRTPPGLRVQRAAGTLLALGALLVVLLAPARPADAAAYDHFYANFAGEELMRVTNADRAALGLPALAADPVLEHIARDRSLACPSNPNLTIRGRARDMADRNYLSHLVQGCQDASGGSFDGLEFLRASGYSSAAAAENIGSNNYPTTSVPYATGCSLSGGSCVGSVGGVPQTVALVQHGFMGSSAHRSVILSTSMDRFGCAAWNSSAGARYYVCYFARSGSGQIDSTGPSVTGMSGAGATFPPGSTPTFSATATDGQSLLSDGWAAIDGTHIRNWAWDHASSSATLSATAPPLATGSHTFTWSIRDASSRTKATSFTFTVGGSTGGTPKPTVAPTPKATPTTRPTPFLTAAPTRTAGSTPRATAPIHPVASAVAVSPAAPSVAPGSSDGGTPGSPSSAGATSAVAPPRASSRDGLSAATGPDPSGGGAGAAIGVVAIGGLLAVGFFLGGAPRGPRRVSDAWPRRVGEDPDDEA